MFQRGNTEVSLELLKLFLMRVVGERWIGMVDTYDVLRHVACKRDEPLGLRAKMRHSTGSLEDAGKFVVAHLSIYNPDWTTQPTH
jgi:hypothetical protein